MSIIPDEPEYETYKQSVVARVSHDLETTSWFRGVCTDSIRESYEAGLSIEQAADIAVGDTMYWDAPNMGLGDEPQS